MVRVSTLVFLLGIVLIAYGCLTSCATNPPVTKEEQIALDDRRNCHTTCFNEYPWTPWRLGSVECQELELITGLIDPPTVMVHHCVCECIPEVPMIKSGPRL